MFRIRIRIKNGRPDPDPPGSKQIRIQTRTVPKGLEKSNITTLKFTYSMFIVHYYLTVNSTLYFNLVLNSITKIVLVLIELLLIIFFIILFIFWGSHLAGSGSKRRKLGTRIRIHIIIDVDPKHWIKVYNWLPLCFPVADLAGVDETLAVVALNVGKEVGVNTIKCCLL